MKSTSQRIKNYVPKHDHEYCVSVIRIQLSDKISENTSTKITAI